MNETSDIDDEKQRSSFSFTFFGPIAMAFSKSAPIFDEADSSKIAVTTFLVAFLILAIVGNVFTCVVIVRDRAMRTATNFYLFSIALSDLLLALWIPVELYTVWFPDKYPLGEFGCVFHIFLLAGLTNFSMLTITAFTLERYIAVVKPFFPQTLSKLSRVVKVVVAIGVVSILKSCPEVMGTYFHESKNYIFCYTYMSLALRWTMGLSDVVVMFVPMVMTSALYVLIAIKLRAKNRMSDKPDQFGHNRAKAIKMLAAVTISFIVCWLPYFITRMMTLFPTHLNREEYYPVWRVIYYLCTITGYMSTAVNPILYSVMSRKFRLAFKSLLKGRKRENERRINLYAVQLTPIK